MATEVFTKALDLLSFWFGNLKTNLYLSFSNVSAKNYIRLVAIVGAYLLLRPYLLKLGMRAQRRSHEAAESPETPGAKISANSIRGAVEIPGESDEEEEEGEGAGTGADANWGKKARKRQRQVVKRLLALEETRLREEEEAEEDQELEAFLMKYGATGKEVVL